MVVSTHTTGAAPLREVVPTVGSPGTASAARRRRRTGGSLLAEMTFGLGIAALLLIPIALTFRADQLYTRALYHRAVAMEVVDGEIEILAAGEWRSFDPGTHDFQPRASVVTNLPPGRFTLTVSERSVKLEWQPAGRHGGGNVSREARIKP